MEEQNSQSPTGEILEDKQVLAEILENTRKTKNYIKWQLYITIALVILPLLAFLAIVPMVLKSVGNMYGSVLQ